MASLIKHLRFLSKTPKATARIMSGVFRTKILRQKKLRNCQMALTFKCNHGCKMCSSSLLLQDKEELTLKQWYNIVNQLKELGCTHFDLTGGEPTLKGFSFLKDLISYINRANDCLVSVATNGTLMDKDWFKVLKKAGLNSILFNIQSLNPSVHDKIVGDEGSLNRIKALIPLAKKEGLNICANTYMDKNNMDDIEKLVVWCEKNDLFTLINLAAPAGRASGKDLRITEYREKYYKMLNSHPLARSDTSYNFRGYNLCPGGIEKIYITAYGEVMQCSFCQISFGNVLEEPIKDIYKRFSEHPLIKQNHICKHSFNSEFRKKWIDPINGAAEFPVPLKKHPNYHLFFGQKK